MRPDWWPAWIPAEDTAGHELAPGKVSLHRCDCTDEVHHVYRCRIDGCRATPVAPPGCVGT